MDTYVYSIEDNFETAKTIYVNLTNKCTNSCIFCIRRTVDNIKGKKMWLENEDFQAKDVIKQFEKCKNMEEVVFCGYGEPFMKFDLIKGIASYLKEKGIKVRINTNGIGNAINGRNVIPEIKNLVDEISISFNAPTKEQYDEISKPIYPDAYEEMKKFAQLCVENDIDTTLSVVTNHPDYQLDLQACEDYANSIGAKFRVREWLNNGY